MKVKVIGIVILSVMCFHQTFAGEEILPDDGFEERPLSKSCLRCLCEVMGCQSGSFKDTWGVFRITLGYWETANYRRNESTNSTNIQEYQDCTNNLWCSVRTIQRYMRQHLPAIQSKRPDRLLCENALALHQFGSHRGHQDLKARSHKKLFTCLHKRVSKWLDTDKR